MSTPSRPTCDCKGAGYCERHKINKSEKWVRLCKMNQSYFDAWERGVGPGQLAMVRQQPETINSHIGDILARRFEAIGIKPTPGCKCKDTQNKLNSMTPQAVESDINGWAFRLQRNAKQWQELKGSFWAMMPTPPLWLCRRVLEDAVREAKGLIDATVLTSKDETVNAV